MSIVKRMMEEDEQKREAARELLIKVGVLTRCDIHEDIIFTAHAGDVTDAYKLGNANWNDLSDLFKDRREMTDTIKAVSEDGDYANDRCEQCASVRD